MQWFLEIKSCVLESDGFGFKPQLCYILAMPPWKKHIVYINFLIYKMEVMTLYFRLFWGLSEMGHTKYVAQSIQDMEAPISDSHQNVFLCVHMIMIFSLTEL